MRGDTHRSFSLFLAATLIGVVSMWTPSAGWGRAIAVDNSATVRYGVPLESSTIEPAGLGSGFDFSSDPFHSLFGMPGQDSETPSAACFDSWIAPKARRPVDSSRFGKRSPRAPPH